MAEESSRDDVVYRWTIRTLYLVGFALNAWLLWDQVKDTPEGQVLRARARSSWLVLSYPLRERAIFRKQANQVVYEAITIVEEAKE